MRKICTTLLFAAPSLAAPFFAAVSAMLVLFAPGVVQAESVQKGAATDFRFTAIAGAPMPLTDFKGRVLLVVNVASFCGVTMQNAGLQALHERFAGQGLVVIDVPANDFGD